MVLFKGKGSKLKNEMPDTCNKIIKLLYTNVFQLLKIFGLNIVVTYDIGVIKLHYLKNSLTILICYTRL